MYTEFSKNAPRKMWFKGSLYLVSVLQRVVIIPNKQNHVTTGNTTVVSTTVVSEQPTQYTSITAFRATTLTGSLCTGVRKASSGATPPNLHIKIRILLWITFYFLYLEHYVYIYFPLIRFSRYFVWISLQDSNGKCQNIWCKGEAGSQSSDPLS